MPLPEGGCCLCFGHGKSPAQIRFWPAPIPFHERFTVSSSRDLPVLMNVAPTSPSSCYSREATLNIPNVADETWPIFQNGIKKPLLRHFNRECPRATL